MASFILSYGLVALFIGMLLEGELLFITGVILAKMGHFSLFGALIAMYLGAVGHDWIFYLLGKKQGQSFFTRRPALQKKLDFILVPFNKRPLFFFISYRFLIGFRMIILALFGLSGVTTKQFIGISLLSNALWVSFYGFTGYYFADTVIANVAWINAHKIWIISSVVALLIIFYNLPKVFAHHPVE